LPIIGADVSADVIEFRTRKKGAGGKAGLKRINFHGQKFVGIPNEILLSPVISALSGNDWATWMHISRVLSCELRGDVFKNGQISITHDQFVAAGVGRKYVAGSIRVLVALGLITVERGLAGAEGYRRASLYGLTMHPAGTRNVAENTWSRFKDVVSAKAAARDARAEKSDGSHKSWELYGSLKSEEVALC
jgi:hypothetical protein